MRSYRPSTLKMPLEGNLWRYTIHGEDFLRDERKCVGSEFKGCVTSSGQPVPLIDSINIPEDRQYDVHQKRTAMVA